MSDQVRAVINKLVEALGGEEARSVLNEAGVLVLMPMKVGELPAGSRVHLSPATVSLNWPEGAYRPFVNGDSKVFVNVLQEGVR